MIGQLEMRRLALFEDLDERQLDLVSSIVEYRDCPAETTVVAAGTLDRGLYLIYSGSVRIVKRNGASESQIAEVLPGQHFGEVTFIEGGTRTATAITNERTELLVIDPERFLTLAEAEPGVGFRISWSILRLLSNRLRNTDHWLFELMETGESVVGV